MPQDKTQLVDVVQHPDFWIFAALFIAGTVTMALKKKAKPINLFEFIGECVLAGGLAFLCWIFGLYQGLDSFQITLIALPAAYGQVNLIQRLMTVKGSLTNDKPTK